MKQERHRDRDRDRDRELTPIKTLLSILLLL